MNFYIISLIKFGLVAFVFLTALAYLQWIERKVIAHVQVRATEQSLGLPVSRLLVQVRARVLPPTSRVVQNSRPSPRRRRAAAHGGHGQNPARSRARLR